MGIYSPEKTMIMITYACYNLSLSDNVRRDIPVLAPSSYEEFGARNMAGISGMDN